MTQLPPGSRTGRQAVTDTLTWIPRPVDPVAIEQLRAAGHQVALGYGDDPRTFENVAPEVTGVLLRSAPFDAGMVSAAPRLRIIARHGVGYDTVDVDAATRAGVVVTITADANAQSVAEHVFALTLALARDLSSARTVVEEGRWHDARSDLRGQQLGGRTLGLLGCGRIGRRVAAIGRGFGMTLLVCDPAVDDDAAATIGATSVTIDALFSSSDVVSIHLPLTASTTRIVDASRLALLPQGALLINTSRGAVIDEDALVEALVAGRVAGAGLDVLAQEPPTRDHPLVASPRTVVTPHVGGQTAQAMRHVATEAAASILQCYAGEKVSGSLNR